MLVYHTSAYKRVIFLYAGKNDSISRLVEDSLCEDIMEQLPDSDTQTILSRLIQACYDLIS